MKSKEAIVSSGRLTQAQLRAINEALAFRLTDEIEGEIGREHYESAKEIIERRIHWRIDE